MRFVDRTAEPAPLSLTNEDGVGANELLNARAHFTANPPAQGDFEFRSHKSADVKQALQNLFHGKCAYCESRFAGTQPPDIEHYRPKGAVKESKPHPGYWWLAMAWDNLLPACIDCNRRRGQVAAAVGMTLAELDAALKALGDTEPGGKHDSFPTLDSSWAEPENDPEPLEQPLLIDPTRTDPKEHLVWVDGEVPVVIPVADAAGVECPRAAMSIHIYALNRLGLVQCRSEVLRGLEAQAETIRDLMDFAEWAPPDKKPAALLKVDAAVMRLRTFCGPSSEYSAMAEVFIERFEAELLTSRTKAAEAA